MDWASAVVALGGVAVGGGLGIVGTLIAGRQARAQARTDRVADLGRVEAVALLGACAQIWKARMRFGVPSENQDKALVQFNDGIAIADRAADALMILTDSDREVLVRLINAASGSKERPTEDEYNDYQASRAHFTEHMRKLVNGTRPAAPD